MLRRYIEGQASMSEWYETETDDIDMDWEKREVNIHVATGEWGNIYKTLTYDQIRDIYKQLPPEETE